MIIYIGEMYIYIRTEICIYFVNCQKKIFASVASYTLHTPFFSYVGETHLSTLTEDLR
jgi:hypothetical protein